VVEKKEFRLNLAAKKSAYITTDVAPTECYLGASVDVVLYAPNGNLLGELSQVIPCKIIEAKEELIPVKLTEESIYIYAKGENFKYRFNKQLGNLDSMVVNGEELLFEPVKLSAFRAATDNDKRMIFLWAKKDEWQGEHIDYQFTNVYDVKVENGTIVANASIGGISRVPFFIFS
jgi:hypothetical protein